MLKNIINSLGIILNIVGAWIVFKESPVNFAVIDANIKGSFMDHVKATNKKNRWIRNGVYILIAGSIGQLISNFIPE